MKRRIFGVIIGLFCALMFMVGCGEQAKPQEIKSTETLSFFALNTYVSLSASGENAKEALQAARQVIETYEDKWSVTDNRSELYAVNHGGGIKRTISSETAEILRYALNMCKSTNGALDITVYPVLKEWGFTTGEYKVPTEERIAELMTLVGYEKIFLDGNDITVPNGMELDLGAVAKGYIGDLVIATLKEYGIQSAIVNLGGNIQLIGRKSDGMDWNIGIRSPFENENFAALKLNGKAIITSGGYQRNFTDDDDNVYHHIMNPQTGKPANSGLVSVSIIADDGKLCDSLSTACFVMGAEKAIEYWKENGNFDMVLVTENREIFITDAIADRFTLSKEVEWKVNVIRK